MLELILLENLSKGAKNCFLRAEKKKRENVREELLQRLLFPFHCRKVM